MFIDQVSNYTCKEFPFEGKLAAIYNNNLSVLGGGERSTLAYAAALSELGFKVEVLSLNDIPSAEQIAHFFGRDFSRIQTRRISPAEARRLLISTDYSLFMNHTYMSTIRNPAKVGIYAQMFPVQVLKKPQNLEEIESLKSYNMMLCNSSFTRKYTIERWDYDPQRTYVVNPPISEQFIGLSRDLEKRLPPKKKQIVNLGRYNPKLHNKNQLVIIDVFLEALSTYSSLKDWTLVLVGDVGNCDTNKRYFLECVKLAEKSNCRVVFKNDLSVKELSTLLSESFGYVHATGAFLPGDLCPEKCEHFGLAIAEAMAHACVPLVYYRGGIFDVLDVNRGCITYATREELKEGFLKMAALYNSKEGALMQQCNLKDIKKLRFSSFARRLGSLLQPEFAK